MDSQKTMHYFALSATDEMKQHFKNLWNDYETSVAIGFPYFLVPKYLGDIIGSGALEDIATRFSIHSAQDIEIQYDPTKEAYVIGPAVSLNRQYVFRTLKNIEYKPGITTLPAYQPWTPPTNSFRPLTALNLNLPNSQTPVAKNKVPKSPNAFLLYRRDKYAAYCAENTESRNMPNKNFSTIAGQMWANETDEVRAEYYSRARKLKDKSSGKISQGESSRQI